MCKKCTQCERTMSYDPYFKANVCRYCGKFEAVSNEEYQKKKLEIVKSQKQIVNNKLICK